MTPVQAEVVHRLPGRIRLRLGEKRGDADYFASLSENLDGCEGVERVKASPSTGGILIEFSCPAESLERQMKMCGISLDLHDTSAGETRPRNAAANRNPAPFHLVSNREINPMFMLGTTLAVLGIVQALRGKILGPSLSMLWYAAEAFRHSGTARITEGSTDGEFRRH